MTRTLLLLVVTLSALGLLAPSHPACAQGLAMSGVGPVNSSMAGAATAAPLEASGAIMWNPATITGLECNEVSLGVSLVMPSAQIDSRIAPGSLGGGFPPFPLEGSDRSEAGVAAVPNLAWVEHLGDSPWTVGLGVFGIGGFKVNYPASTTNPILTPAPPGGLGVGRVSAEAEIMQILPTLSCLVTDRLSIGFAPSVSLARISAESLVFAAPDDANGDRYGSYPSGRGGRLTWGGGFQLGAYYTTDADWNFGATFKSPQWFESFRFKATDELGAPRTEKLRFRYPLIVSLGTSYTGIDRWVFAIDARLFDWGNAAGFREYGFRPDGAIAGFGWSSVFASSIGVQYQATDAISLRCGYSYNQNPIHEMDAGFNVASPVISQHFGYLGSSLRLSEHTVLAAAYIHGFENEVTGPMQTPLGPLPGSSVTSQVSLDALSLGLIVQY